MGLRNYPNRLLTYLTILSRNNDRLTFKSTVEILPYNEDLTPQTVPQTTPWLEVRNLVLLPRILKKIPLFARNYSENLTSSNIFTGM